MPVPKRKRSRARRDKRFANKGMSVKALATCANCSVALMPHQACGSCGFYKGTKVLVTKADRRTKRDQQRKATEEARKGASTPPADGE